MPSLAEHLTEAELRAYREKTMSPESRVDACAHIAECEECLALYSSLPERHSSTAALEAFTGFDKPWIAEAVALAESHLTYQEMCDWVNGTVTGIALQKIEAHRVVCPACQEDVEKLGIFLKAPAPAQNLTPLGSLGSSGPASSRFGSQRSVWAMIGGSALVGACAACVILYLVSVRPLSDELAATKANNGGHSLPTVLPSPLSQDPHVAPIGISPEATKRIADLSARLQTAAKSKAALDKEVQKERQRSATLRTALAAANRKQAERPAAAAPDGMPLPIASLTKTLADGKFGLLTHGPEFAMNVPSNLPLIRGGDVTPVSPDATVTAITPRIVTFHWANTSFSDHFQLVVTDITDAPAKKTVASTEPGEGVTGTEWASPIPLARGHVYVWTITPSRKGRTLAASSAVFRTADTKTAARYAHLQLLLAISQVQDRLYDQAAATLQEIVADFADLPEGAKAAQLLESLRMNLRGLKATAERRSAGLPPGAAPR